ncbi:unnamed protein product [Urochloa humidicola]
MQATSGVRQQLVSGRQGGWSIGPAVLVAQGSDHTTTSARSTNPTDLHHGHDLYWLLLLVVEATCSLIEIAFTWKNRSTWCSNCKSSKER